MVGILRDTNYTTPVFTQVLSVWKKSDTFIVVGAVQLLATSRISDCGFYEFVFDYHQLVQLPEKKKKDGMLGPPLCITFLTDSYRALSLREARRQLHGY